MTFEPTQAMTQIIDSVLLTINQSLSLNAFLWLLLTVSCYGLSLQIFRVGRSHPLLHPLVFTVGLVAIGLELTNVGAEEFTHHTLALQWLLGPATVALAIPLYNQWQKISHLGTPLIVSIACGGILASILAWLCMYFTHAPIAIQMTMLAKSITSPLAMETSHAIGGIAPLAAAFVIVTGMVGAITANLVFTCFKVTLPEAQGVALGTVCHAVGTAKAIHMGEIQGALATVGLGVNGMFTALVLPAFI